MNNFYNYPNYNKYQNNQYPTFDDQYKPTNEYEMRENTSNYLTNDLYSPYEGFIRGNMFTNLYSPYNTNIPYEIKPMNRQAEMLTNIDSLTFAMIDINLYLDVYPNDKKLIKEFNNIQMQKQKLLMEYEKEFGPLLVSNNTNDNYWSWVENPWPWNAK